MLTVRSRLLVVTAISLVALLAANSDADAKRRRGGGHAKVGKRGRRGPAPIAPLTKDGFPNVQAAAAVVIDLDTGEEVYAKNPDSLRPIASVGKLFAALAVRHAGIKLDGITVITPDDRRIASGGARSRLFEGKGFTNHDLLRAMLIASDNRAVPAVGRGAGLDPAHLIAGMNEAAKRLGLTKTKFTDPTGLNGNVSTPREIAVALRAALADPVLAPILGAHEADVASATHPRYQVHYNNTNVSLRTSRHSVIGGKTGYTDEAKYCLAIAATIAGRRFAMVFLGAEGELTRFADFGRTADWLLAANGHPKPAPHARTPGLGIGVDPPAASVTARIAR